MWNRLKTWWLSKKLERALDKELRSTGTEYIIRNAWGDLTNTQLSSKHYYTQDETQRKYAEGLIKLKAKVNSMIKERTAEEYNKILISIDELFTLAREETEHQKVLRKTLEKIYVKKKADVKSKKDKKNMINDRIQHFEELKQHKVERELLRNIRKAHKENNKELADKLQEEWSLIYGKKLRNPK